MQEKIQALESLRIQNSGLDDLISQEESEKLYVKQLGLFLTAKNQELDDAFQARPDLINSVKSKALFLMNLIMLGKKLLPMHISLSPKPGLTDLYASALIKLYACLKQNIIIEDHDFFQYKKFMPSISIYYSDLLLKETYYQSDAKTRVDILDKVFIEITDPKNFESLYSDDLKAQQSRLLALYHRRQGNLNKALEHINHYRKSFSPDLKKTISITKIKPKQGFPKEKVLDKLKEIYQEVQEIQEEVLIRTGVYENTCFYFQCTDCCHKDFPTVSLTEFLHIKNWLSENKIDITRFANKAEEIQNEHENLFGEKLKIVDQLRGKKDENLHGYQFTCPFLGDDHCCQIHEARPLACRSFGLATIDNSSVQACQYYLTQYQYNSSHENEREVYDSRITTALVGASNNYLAKKEGLEPRQPVATLVAWLSEFN